MRCSRRWFESRCRQVGRTVEDCRACIVRDDGDALEVDASHEAYPRPGLGDRVAAGLEAVGVTEERVARAIGRKDCGCKQRRSLLNRLGKALGLS